MLRCCVALVALSSYGIMRELKGKVIPLQDGVVQRVGRGIAVYFHDCGTRRVSGQQHARVTFYLWERPGSHFSGIWVGLVAVPLQALSFPEVSLKIRYPDFMTTQDGGKVVSLKHRPPLPQRNTPVTQLC